MDTIRERLAKLAGQPKLVQLTRDYPGDQPHHGFVLGVGHDLVLLHEFSDFCPYGYAALRVADVKRVRSGRQERFWQKMFRGEGLMTPADAPFDVPLDNFRSLLATLYARGRYIIVQCEDRETDDNNYFDVGRIVRWGESSISFLGFTTTGKWFEKPWTIPYKNITQVEFDTPYINTYAKYLKPPPIAGRQRRTGAGRSKSTTNGKPRSADN